MNSCCIKAGPGATPEAPCPVLSTGAASCGQRSAGLVHQSMRGSLTLNRLDLIVIENQRPQRWKLSDCYHTIQLVVRQVQHLQAEANGSSEGNPAEASQRLSVGYAA